MFPSTVVANPSVIFMIGRRVDAKVDFIAKADASAMVDGFTLKLNTAILWRSKYVAILMQWP